MALDPLVQAFCFIGVLMFIFDVIALENIIILFLGGFLLLSPWKLLAAPY
ncbi:Uncharacterised protein [Candidatus Norongarragalina meridionalis]|nr:Uncharacterised protein [Candidatus Norongarragalina meridionalis]